MGKFLHIFYKERSKKNRVFNISDTTIEFRTDTKVSPKELMVEILIHSEKLLFSARMLHIDGCITVKKGKFDFNVSGLDRKNRNVKIYTDNIDGHPLSASDTDSDLFTNIEIDVAFDNYKEI